jgi:hypothetical protein
MTPQELVAGAMLERNQQANRLGIPQQMGAFANSLGMVPTPQQEALQEPLIAPETYGIGTMLKKAAPMLPGALGMTVYHGSPHSFDKFDLSKVGTGQSGGTSFGLGINLSKDINHAKVYAGDKGHVYKVDLPDESLDKFITWEKPVSGDLAKQLPPVDLSKPIPFGGNAVIDNRTLKTGTAAFPLNDKEFNRMFGNENTGEQVYRKLVAAFGGDERAASQWLNEHGIKGTINNTERGAQNFVVFDDTLPKIVGKE